MAPHGAAFPGLVRIPGRAERFALPLEEGQYGPVQQLSRRQAQKRAGRPIGQPRSPEAPPSAQQLSKTNHRAEFGPLGALYVNGHSQPVAGYGPDGKPNQWHPRKPDLDAIAHTNLPDRLMLLAQIGADGQTLIKFRATVTPSATEWMPGSDAYCKIVGWKGALDSLYLRNGEPTADDAYLRRETAGNDPLPYDEWTAAIESPDQETCIRTEVKWNEKLIKSRLEESATWNRL